MTELGRSSAAATIAVPGSTDVVELHWGASTDIGRKRGHNEDSLLAESPLFVVADGMGGHAAGDVASAAVVTRLSEAVTGDFADVETIIHALRTATADITLADDADDLGVGTTVTGAALIVRGGEPVWAVFNIGDSRVYEFGDSALRQVTTDHSVVQELVDAGLVRQEDAEFHPDSNVITRAVGFNVEPFADVWLLPVRPGSRLLICSDGLTREVDHAGLANRMSAGRPPQETADELVSAALAGGGRDNITTVVVDVVAAPDPRELDTTIPRGMAARG